MAKKKVGVLYGGWSAERNISLKSGAAVLKALKRLGLPHVAIDVTPDAANQIRRAKIDVVFLAVHGPFGEDGRLQGLLDILNVPYTGSGVLASALAMHKPSAKRVFAAAGLPTPEWRVVSSRDRVPLPALSHPWIVKPASQGSALGVSVVRRPADWAPALKAALALDTEALIERHIAGPEITVGVLNGKALPVVEIVPKHVFYDFYSKYAKGGSRHLIPARLPAKVQARAQELAVAAHDALGCRHMARVDFMVGKDGRPWILEVNTLPGLTDVSLLPDAARAAGLDFDRLVATLLSLAVKDGGANR